MFKKGKMARNLVLVLLISLALGTVVSAAEKVYTKKMEAIYGSIRFEYEGEDVTDQIEKKYGTPGFIVKGESRSYIPVRAGAEVFGLDVDYDPATMTAIITDPKNQLIKEKDQEIEKLNARVKELEGKLDKIKEDQVDQETLASLEKKARKDYANFEGVDFQIQFKEASNNNISISMTTDFRTTNEKMAWYNMRSSKRQELLKGVTDPLAKEYPKSSIKGEVYDNFDKRSLLEFKKEPGKDLSITASHNLGHPSNIDRFVEEEFDYYGIRDARIDRYLGDYMELSFTSKYEKDWKRLSLSEIERLLDRVADEMEYDSHNQEIRIYMDDKHIGTYDRYYNEHRGRYQKR